MKAVVALLLWLLMPAAWAHKPSDSYLTIDVKAATIEGRWDIALRDLDFALTLDADGNGELTWGEVRARHADIAAYAREHLRVTADDRPCALDVGAQQVDEHTDGHYSVLPLALQCEAASPSRLALTYTLFADLDPQHRGLLKLTVQGATRTAVLGPQQALQHMTAQASRGDDQPLAVLGEEVPVGTGLVVVALEVGTAAQLDEVPVALVGLGQRGEVVVELGSTLGVAPAVVEAATARRALMSAVMGHVELGPEHGLDPLGPALLVEVQDPVHVAVVGDAQGRLAVSRRGCHHVGDPSCSIEHRVLGVDMEVREAVSHPEHLLSSSTRHPQGRSTGCG